MSPKPKIRVPSAVEEQAINRAVAGDPDTFEFTDAEFERAKRGRPFSVAPKQAVSLRLDPDILDHFKAEGRGWQTRINAALRKAIGASQDR